MSRATNRVRRSAEDWQALIAGQERSGLSRVAFCRREGIGPTSFDKWKRRLLARRPAEFVDVTPRSASPTAWDMEVALPNGVVLRFRG